MGFIIINQQTDVKLIKYVQKINHNGTLELWNVLPVLKIHNGIYHYKNVSINVVIMNTMI